MGTGRYSDIPIVEDGVSWRYRKSNRSDAWPTTFINGTTGSYTGSNYGGGAWFTASVTQSFSYYTTKDINVNVSSLVNMWYNGTILKNENEFYS